MARAYCVSYDLNRIGQRYAALYEELKRSPGWCHYLDSTWLVATGETVTALAQRLRTRMDANDSILVIEIRRSSDGWLPQEAWDWINENVPL